MNSNFTINEFKMKDKRAKSKIIQQSPLQRNAAAGDWLLFVGRGFYFTKTFLVVPSAWRMMLMPLTFVGLWFCGVLIWRPCRS